MSTDSNMMSSQEGWIIPCGHSSRRLKSGPRPGTPVRPPAASPALHAPGGSLPPVRLADARRRRLSPTSDRRSSGRRLQRPRARAPSTSSASGRRAVPLQVVQDFNNSDSFTWNPMQQGTYDIQVVVKNGYRSSKSESTSATYTAQTRVVGDTRRGQPDGQPPGRPVQRAPVPGHVDVRPVRPAGHRHRRGRLPRRCPSSPARAPTSSWPACCPNTTYLMRYVAGRRDRLGPADVHHRELAGEPELPHLDRGAAAGGRDRSERGRALPRRVRRRTQPRRRIRTPWRPT